ncbi:hypothetical protein Ga0080574_TMP1679 [Salipiger abyssi]|uniref:Uncharacterized protein n=1 Tax=Salipiger abyssi TaxID=1250539 RepID=A0A1P8URI1_9RHOB|nr:hypothetical protein Ga0080574_TMP1679 [Salipiger abyssi]
MIAGHAVLRRNLRGLYRTTAGECKGLPGRTAQEAPGVLSGS